MLGLEDRYVALAYLLCILSALACLVYGIVNWNKGEEEELTAEDISWAAEEKLVEEEL